jgi:hypothetical protein
MANGSTASPSCMLITNIPAAYQLLSFAPAPCFPIYHFYIISYSFFVFLSQLELLHTSPSTLYFKMKVYDAQRALRASGDSDKWKESKRLRFQAAECLGKTLF